MRITRMALGGLALTLLGISGCWTTDTHLKPPPRPPEYVLPPPDDARFSEPPNYPDRTLNQGLPKKDDLDLGIPPSMRTPNRFGAGGPGGPGGMPGG
jgi:hypothetical protein